MQSLRPLYRGSVAAVLMEQNASTQKMMTMTGGKTRIAMRLADAAVHERPTMVALTPVAMGKMFYRAVQKVGVETEMVIYPDEGHGIRQLPHREDVLRRTLDWFEKHDLPKSK